MTGRENQWRLYVRDRWSVSQKLTLSLGLRLEYYPLMTRADSGIERLDYNTYTALLGGRGDVPEDVGINLKKWYFAPRIGAMYRLTEKSVVRAGYGRTINPLPWSRPMRGSFPYDINLLNKTSDIYTAATTLCTGIPAITMPDISTGHVPLPPGVFFRSPNPDDVDRGIIQQWNVAFEQRLPWDIAAEIAYVGTATDGGYADLNINYGEPGGGNAARQYFSVAGTTAINDWASRTKARYKGMQIALNRPFRNGLMLKGAYTLSQAKNMADEDGWVGLTWNHPAEVRRQLRPRRLRPDAHRPDGLPLRAAVPEGLEVDRGQDLRRLAGQRHRRLVLRHAVLDRRHELGAQLPGLRLGVHQLQRRLAGTDRFGGLSDRDLLRQVALLAADRHRLQRLRHQQAQPVPPADGVERRPVAVQVVPGREGAPADPDRRREHLQPHELGRAGHDVHREQLHAVHPLELLRDRHPAPTRTDRGGFRSACGSSSSRHVVAHDPPARADRT